MGVQVAIFCRLLGEIEAKFGEDPTLSRWNPVGCFREFDVKVRRADVEYEANGREFKFQLDEGGRGKLDTEVSIWRDIWKSAALYAVHPQANPSRRPN